MTVLLTRTSIAGRSWSNVTANVAKIDATLRELPKGDVDGARAAAFARAAAALATGSLSKIGTLAADTLLAVPAAHLDVYSDVLSRRTIGLWGTLAAVANFSRRDILAKVLRNPDFRPFLEAAPVARDIARHFCATRYNAMFSAISLISAELQLDAYFSPAATHLIAQLRAAAVAQAVSPYATLQLQPLATEFQTTVKEMEGELSKLIEDGRIAGRVDASRNVLLAYSEDAREQVFQAAKVAGATFQHNARALLLRQALCQAKILVKAL